jgi:lipid-binding SYLF domain-containing protein
MNSRSNLLLSLAFLSISTSSLVHADDVDHRREEASLRARLGEIKDINHFHRIVDESTEAYRSIVKGPHGEVPASILRDTRCIAVLPGVISGAVLVGGGHGSGLASCKNSDNSWSQPAPVSYNQGSVGFQAGAKSADLVMFFQSRAAVAALKRGDVSMGSEVSAVAGSYDAGTNTAGAGVVVYSRSEGLFAGVSLNGGTLRKDQQDIASYYGKQVDYTELLESRVGPDTSGYTTKLTKLFP